MANCPTVSDVYCLYIVYIFILFYGLFNIYIVYFVFHYLALFESCGFNFTILLSIDFKQNQYQNQSEYNDLTIYHKRAAGSKLGSRCEG